MTFTFSDESKVDSFPELPTHSFDKKDSFNFFTVHSIPSLLHYELCNNQIKYIQILEIVKLSNPLIY